MCGAFAPFLYGRADVVVKNSIVGYFVFMSKDEDSDIAEIETHIGTFLVMSFIRHLHKMTCMAVGCYCVWKKELYLELTVKPHSVTEINMFSLGRCMRNPCCDGLKSSENYGKHNDI